MSDSLDQYFDRARREMLPAMKDSAMALTILADPDPKLCMELGAAILFDKPILVLARKGMRVPLGLRTIAHKIIEIADPLTPQMEKEIKAAINELGEASKFRGTTVKGT